MSRDHRAGTQTGGDSTLRCQTFGILSSRIHVLWAERAGSRLGVGNDPVYTTSRCVEPFPFPQDLKLDLPPSEQPIAEAIAIAAKRLNDLRENWLNPPEWTQRVPEVIPLGMDASPYPDRIVPKNGHEKELAERTLTKLYNQRPAWLDAAHKTLDAAAAAAYGWADYSADMPDEEILKRLLALNLERAVKVAV